MVLGILLGLLSGLGVGGGSLLMLWLTYRGFPPDTARKICLLFFFPAAILGCRKEAAPRSLVIPAALAGCAGAVLGSVLTGMADPGLFRKGLGVLLILAALGEIRKKES